MVLTNMSAGPRWRCRRGEQTGGGVWGGTGRDEGEEEQTLPRVTQTAGGTGPPSRCSVTTYRGREARQGGVPVYLRKIHAGVGQKPTRYCKAVILQLKRNTF